MKRRYQDTGSQKMNENDVYNFREFILKQARLLCDPLLNTLQDVEYSQCKNQFKEFETYIFGSEIVSNNITTSHKDCGKIFKSNESVYICRDCATDSTCVFCKECFVKSEHIKHNYQMTFSNGGGFCDCGDIEAWKTFPRCKLHGGSNMSSLNYDSLENVEKDIVNLSDDVKIRFLSIIKEIFENFKYFLMRPLCKDEEINKAELENELSLIKSEYRTNNEYGLVLYNNEIHNFDQVISLFKKCLSCSEEQAMEYANIINRDGRCLALVKNDLNILLTKQAQVIGVSKLETGVSFLCRLHHPTFVAIQKLLLHTLRWLFEFINDHKSLRLLMCKYLFHDVQTLNGDTFVKSTFIQDIFNSHSQTWKMARSIISNFIMSSVMKETYFKRLFAIEFVKNYKMTIEHYSADDHNIEDSLTSLSCQIFTVPSLAKYLLDNNNVLRKVIQLSYDELLKYSKPLILDDVEHPLLLYFNKAENLFHTKFDSFEMHLESLNDVEYLLASLATSLLGYNGDEEKTSTSLVLSSWTSQSISNFMDYFRIFAEILSLIQDTNVIQRMTDIHIEEDPPWRTGVLIMHDLVSVVTLTYNLIVSNDVCWDESFILFRQIFKNRVIDFESKKIVSFEFNGYKATVIDNDWPNKYISIIKPLHRFMSSFLIRASYIKQLEKMEVDCLFDQALQMVVFTSQQAGNMWVRNGSVPYVLSEQIKSLVLAPEMYTRDIQIIQQIALCIKPEEFIVKCIHKFDLKNYFISDVDTMLEKQSILQKVEDFLHLLILTLFYRYHPGVGKGVSQEMYFESIILHIISVKPMTHSKIMKKLPQVLQKYPKIKLMNIIKKVSDQSKPSRVIIFTPKKSFIKTKFDRFSPYYSIQDRNEAELNVQNILKEDIISVLTPPEPIDLSEDFSGLYFYLSDPCLINVINMILQLINEKENGEYWTDTMLDMVLYLVGACLMEDLKVLENRPKPDRRTLFLEIALDPTYSFKIIEYLECICNKIMSEKQQELIRWTIKIWYDVKKKAIFNDNAEDVKMETESVNVIQQNKLTKADVAKKRKEQLLKKMQNMQKVFIKDNANLLINASEDLSTHNLRPSFKDLDLTCILCQEKFDNDCERPIVTVAAAWRSTVLAKNSLAYDKFNKEESSSSMLFSEEEKVEYEITTPSFNEAVSDDNTDLTLFNDRKNVRQVLPNLEHREETFITTCGHVMHYDCKTKYMDDMIKSKQAISRTNGIFYPRIFTRCPLCKCVYNIDIPIIKEENLPSLEKVEVVEFEEWFTFFINWAPNKKLMESKKVIALDHWWNKLSNKLHKITQQKEAHKENYSEASENELLSCLAFRVHSATQLELKDLVKETSKEVDKARNSISESSFKEILDLDYSVSYTLSVWDKILMKQNLSLVYDLPERHMLGLNHLIKAVKRSHEQFQKKETLKHDFQSFLVLLQQMLFDCTNSDLHKMWAHFYKCKAPIFILEIDFTYVLTNLLLMRDSFHEIHTLTTEESKFLQTSSYNVNIVRLIYRYASLQALLSLQIPKVDDIKDTFSQLQTDNPTIWSEDNINNLYKSRLDLTQQLSQSLVLPVMTKYEVAVLFSRSMMSYFRCSTVLLTILGPITSLPRIDNCNKEFNYLMDLYGLNICTNDDNLLTSSFQCHLGMINACEYNQIQSIWGTKLPFCLPMTPPKLIDLPNEFIDVLNLCTERGCSLRRKSDNVVTEICLCLICGDTFCLNGYCCRYSYESSFLVLNGAQMHARKCHGGYSLFLNISTCRIVVMVYHARWQILLDPVYVDNYGEYDVDLKTGNPLFLNIDAYKKLERSWLEHSLGYVVNGGLNPDDLFV